MDKNKFSLTINDNIDNILNISDSHPTSFKLTDRENECSKFAKLIIDNLKTNNGKYKNLSEKQNKKLLPIIIFTVKSNNGPDKLIKDCYDYLAHVGIHFRTVTKGKIHCTNPDTTKTICIESYSNKSYVVRYDRNMPIAIMKSSILIYKRNLKGGKGWIFPKSKLLTFKSIIAKYGYDFTLESKRNIESRIVRKKKLKITNISETDCVEYTETSCKNRASLLEKIGTSKPICIIDTLSISR